MGPPGGFVEGAAGPGLRPRVVSVVTVVGVGVEGAGIAHDRLLRLSLIRWWLMGMLSSKV